jgi:hypothetical protein
MSRRRKVILACLAMFAGVLGLGAGYVLYAVREVQPFYAAAIETEPEVLESAGRRMEQRVDELYDQPQPGNWSTVFTDEEVNGWLARYLQEDQPTLLPPEVVDPRVAFVEGGCKLGFRYAGASLDAVVTVEAEAYMVEENLAAVRFRQARLGALPISMSTVISHISKGAATLKIPIRWTEADGDPVLLAPVTDALSTPEETRSLARLVFSEGQVSLTGATTPRSRATLPVVTQVEAAAGR